MTEEWTALGVGTFVGMAAWAAKQYFFTKKDSSHDKLDQTRADIIEAYEKRIKQLEERHAENEIRITALEESIEKQAEVMKKQEEYIKILVDLVQGRDPEIQAFLMRGSGALDLFEKETAPKVSEIHSHFVKPEDMKGAEA